MTFKEFLNEAGFKNFPPGWTNKSVKKWYESFKEKHGEEDFFDKCVLHMKDELGDGEDAAKRFCAAVKDEYYKSTYWRSGAGKPKSEKEIEADTKAHKNIPYKPKGKRQKQIVEK